MLIPLLGFLPSDDERVRATVLAIADELTEDELVLRYKVEETDDGFDGEEGTFTICSFWLVSALAEIGEVARARALCTKLLAYASPLGLYAGGDRSAQRAAPRELPASLHTSGVDQCRDALDPRGRAAARRRTAGRSAMRAIAIVPGRPDTAGVIDVPEPPASDGSVLVRTRLIGICGTDVEIAVDGYGVPPPGEDRLVLGHESLGEVIDAPDDSNLSPGDLVVGVVRRPDPVPCAACAADEWDMCQNGGFVERGIKDSTAMAANASASTRGSPSVSTRRSATSVCCSNRRRWWPRPGNTPNRSACAPWFEPEVALITGAGPIGLLAALLARQRGLETHVVDLVTDGPKPPLVADLGAHYHSGPVGRGAGRGRTS